MFQQKFLVVLAGEKVVFLVQKLVLHVMGEKPHNADVILVEKVK